MNDALNEVFGPDDDGDWDAERRGAEDAVPVTELVVLALLLLLILLVVVVASDAVTR